MITRSLVHTLWITLVATLLVPMVSAEEGLREGPTESQQEITGRIARYLGSHLSNSALDNDMSEKFLENFIEALDPNRDYFLQADIDEFNFNRHNLDDHVKQGKPDFAFIVYRQFLRRIDQAVAYADEFIKAEHDYTIDETLSIDPDVTQWAASKEGLKDRWRRRIKYQLMVERHGVPQETEVETEATDEPAKPEATEETKGPETAAEPKMRKRTEEEKLTEAQDILTKRYHNFQRRRKQVDNWELLEMYLTALTSCYDPHTAYWSPKVLEDFEIAMRLELDGIGAALTERDGYTVVSQIIAGGAADRDGRLKPEDKIVGVGQGENGEILDVIGMKLNDVVPKIRGKRDTIVRLMVLPAGKTARVEYKLTRARVELKDQEAQARVIEHGSKNDGQPYKVGVISIPSFYRDMSGESAGKVNFKSTTVDVRRIIGDFKKDGVDAVLVDLRINGGGSLTEAIELTGLFIDQGPVVQVRGLIRTESYPDTDRGVTWDGPLVVYTSKGSASASEIFAGAIKDYNRGIIVGDSTTHGKGTVQRLVDIPEGGALKLTTQQFYRPTGDSTQNRGVPSDIVIPSLTDHLYRSESELDYALPFDQIAGVAISNYNRLDPDLIGKLNSLSKDRRSRSEDFQQHQKEIQIWTANRDKKYVSLNEARYLQERELMEQVRTNLLEETDPEAEEKIPLTFFLEEALAITVDYVRLALGEGVERSL